MSECTAGCEVLRAAYEKLTAELDARIVAVNMYQRNALTLKEMQSIQYLRDRPVEATEMLLNIIIEQPDAVYLCFLDVLKHTEQQHIYQRLISDGYKGQQNCYNDKLLSMLFQFESVKISAKINWINNFC